MSRPHARRVFRQGDSLVVTIPSEIARELGIRDGDEVIVEISEENVVLRKYFK